ncbi:MAG TPA: glycosyltransferase family 2 protein [Cytophagaceae bacterium]|jgi:glycosyltransferase involved in cell wall biosynthesis|nr:glycosyltransferase family 2 protein [Cytophagaceae bacterium]
MKISVVIPVYNAAATIGSLVEDVQKSLPGYDAEIILVNDCSSDQSEKICEELATKHPFIRFVSLRKNSGEHNAVLCGLNYITGDYVVIIDDDYQNPPSEIVKLINKIREGNYDVVYSKYSNKKHSIHRNLGSRINDRIATILLNKPRDLYLSSFKVMHQDIAKEITKYKGPHPYIDGLILRVTDNIGTAEVEHHKRKEGVSNYTFNKLFSLYLNMFLNFSVKPLRVFTLIGTLIFILGIVLAISVVLEKYLYGGTPPGWTFTIVIILTISGFQVMFLGILGEYLGKLFLMQNGTPQYTIKKVIVDSRELNIHD